MKVIFGFDNQFIGKYETENDTTRKQIIELFSTILGISFDDDCYYKIEEE